MLAFIRRCIVRHFASYTGVLSLLRVAEDAISVHIDSTKEAIVHATLQIKDWQASLGYLEHLADKSHALRGRVRAALTPPKPRYTGGELAGECPESAGAVSEPEPARRVSAA